jgi:hypothetical protein
MASFNPTALTMPSGIGLRKAEIELILDEVGMNADGEVRRLWMCCLFA